MLAFFKFITKLIFLKLALLNLNQFTHSSLVKGTIWVACDDYLISISVNGIEITEKGKTFLFDTYMGNRLVNTPISPGDTVTIECSNAGSAWTIDNPAAIIATIRYFEESGMTNYISTGTRWLCNNDYPMFQGTNSNSNWKYNNAALPMIKGNAACIWSKTGAQYTTCSVVIPRKSNAKIFISVDDLIVDIKVNGLSIPIYGDIGTRTSLKNIDAVLNPGDIISITGQNSGNAPWSVGNPAGILATIYWTDASGKMNSIGTGAGWTCDGATPMMQGPNMSRYADFILYSIAADAQWIWGSGMAGTSTCSYTIPTS